VHKRDDAKEKDGKPSIRDETNKAMSIEQFKPPIRFLQRLAKAKLESKFENFFKVL